MQLFVQYTVYVKKCNQWLVKRKSTIANPFWLWKTEPLFLKCLQFHSTPGNDSGKWQPLQSIHHFVVLIENWCPWKYNVVFKHSLSVYFKYLLLVCSIKDFLNFQMSPSRSFRLGFSSFLTLLIFFTTAEFFVWYFGEIFPNYTEFPEKKHIKNLAPIDSQCISGNWSFLRLWTMKKKSDGLKVVCMVSS